MFDIKTFAYDFLDVTLYCVGQKDNVNLLYQYFQMHENDLDSYDFTERIIQSKVYAYLEGKNPKTMITRNKYNKQLKKSGFLMDINYYEEALLIENPIKVIELLDLQELYNQEIEISDYWRERFPTLPEKFVITPNK